MLFLLSSLDFSLYFSPFHFSFARTGLPFTHYPGYKRLFLACDVNVQWGASFCRPQADTCSAEGRRHERRSFPRGSLFKTDRNRKPRMKSLWHPGYSHIRTVTIFGNKWPARKASPLVSSACGRQNEAPSRTRETTSCTQGNVWTEAPFRQMKSEKEKNKVKNLAKTREITFSTKSQPSKSATPKNLCRFMG